MKHLFIINPMAWQARSRMTEIFQRIHGLFKEHPAFEYDIHITRWRRDAVGFIHRYAAGAKDIVRVYAVGGTGTFFEVINGVVGLPNIQVALWPCGKDNSFLRYFGDDRLRLFSALENLVFAGVTGVDVFRCNGNYGLTYGSVGLESRADNLGGRLSKKTGFPADICYISAAVWDLFRRGTGQWYNLDLDGMRLDGAYISMLVANGPCYGTGFSPAVDAHPNDGKLEVYTTRPAVTREYPRLMADYTSGQYANWPEYVSHYSGRCLRVSSDEVMSISLDGELFYEKSVTFELIPYAVDLVCPLGVDMAKLPRIFGRGQAAPPEEVRAHE
ncbi:hypothetical protein LJC32_05765 [Oscillospiraceae bacterium OttesenSCG-928-F05]|nr:hypothetical protein [Oscillospiraceae bacterium OttesenSCG-928-F05]